MTLALVKEASLNKVKLINWRVEMLRIFRVCGKKGYMWFPGAILGSGKLKNQCSKTQICKV